MARLRGLRLEQSSCQLLTLKRAHSQIARWHRLAPGPATGRIKAEVAMALANEAELAFGAVEQEGDKAEGATE